MPSKPLQTLDLLLLCGVIIVGLVLAALFLLPACPSPGYHGNFTNVTHYRLKKETTTPNGIAVSGTYDASILAAIDLKVDQVELCLTTRMPTVKLKREWFGVAIPPDWYISVCSGEQLIPSSVDYKLCEAKGLDIPDACHFVTKPTLSCPCVCNVRSVIQDDYWVLTTPNLKLFKAELIRLVANVNNVWVDERLQPCLN